jgi:hypothetical protein
VIAARGVAVALGQPRWVTKSLASQSRIFHAAGDTSRQASPAMTVCSDPEDGAGPPARALCWRQSASMGSTTTKRGDRPGERSAKPRKIAAAILPTPPCMKTWVTVYA